MVMTDPIADMLSRVRNANTVRHEKLDIPASKVKTQIAEILKREGYVRNYEIIEDNKQNIIRIFMKYGNNDEQVIRGLKRIVNQVYVYTLMQTKSQEYCMSLGQ